MNFKKEQQGLVSLRILYGKPHVFKKILNKLDLSFRLEQEVSRRMKDCNQIYNVYGVIEEGDDSYLVSEYIEGKDFTDAFEELSEQKLLSIVCQVLCLIYLLNVSGISHNDLHCSNIRIQATSESTLDYIYKNRVYSIPSHGVKVVIIDFGSALILEFGEPTLSTSQIFIGDSFLRLDVRYDMCRFLKSFADCLTWKTHDKKCKKLAQLIDRGITTPLQLGIYGIPDHYINAAPKLFNNYVKSLHPNAPIILSDFLAVLNAWPWETTPDDYSIEDTFDFLNEISYSDIIKLKDSLLNENYGPVAAKLKPLVLLWNQFKLNFSMTVSVKIATEFDTKLYIHSPIFIVDWILTGSSVLK